MKRILVTGASGLLGSRLFEILSKDHDVTPTDVIPVPKPQAHAGFVKMDISDRDEVFRVLREFSPAVVVHAAAATNVDKCETDKEWAKAINSVGTRNVAEGSAKIGAKLIYISTDYIFDGEKGYYTEEDKPNPVNHYGLTKLEGEEHVEEACEAFAIARTSVPYGWHLKKLNFATWIIDSLTKRKKITVVSDHYNSPTFTDLLAETIQRIVQKDFQGIFHVSGSESINRYDFALRIADVFGLDDSLIAPTKMTDLKAWIARRPRDSSLCVNKIEETLQIKLPSVVESLKRMKESQPAEHN
ncbi:MAG: dTDP-4-dehydrorhamnose reductase [archaeon]